jgi:exopolyphosphatase / guanosine-5'-triphosphate,3'-diphosphate pyrophosphatase
MTTAAIDIGSNTVRLLIVDDRGRDVERRYVVTGLGRGVDRTRAFRSDSVAHSLGVLRDYRHAIDEHGVTAFRAVATSATRDVSDGAAFLDAAERILGVRPEVITGDEEARLSFEGSLRGGHGTPPYLVIDIGGGSTEFVYGSASPEYVRSADMGSVRLTERALPDRPAIDQLRIARKEADHAFAGLEVPGPVRTGIGVGGTFTTLVTLDRRLPATQVVEGETLTIEQVGSLIDRLARLTVAETAALTGIDPARAPVILGGAVVVERAMAAAGLAEVVASEYDLMDGIALGF